MRLRLLSALAALVLTAVGCTPGEVAMIPEPPPLPSTTTTTAPPDHSRTDLAGVPGRTTTTIAMGPGAASISGTVQGPEGPVAGAVVRAERLVGDATASVDQLSAPDGTFAVPAILGGRYRVRAWKPNPDNLATLDPQVFFLGSAESKVLEFRLEVFQGVLVNSALAPDPPVVNQPQTLVVQVADQSVDENGVVRGVPRVNVRVELFGAGDWQVQTTNPTFTDGAGQGRWVIRCRRPGPQPLSVVVGDATAFPLTIAPCAPPAPEEETTTTSTTGSTTSTSQATTSTTRRTTTTTSSTTTTTRPTTSTTRRR